MSVEPIAESSLLQPDIEGYERNAVVGPALSQTPMKRVHRFKAIIGSRLLIFKTSTI